MANTVGGQVTQDIATQRNAVDLSRAMVLGRVQRGGKDLVMVRYPDGRIEYVEASQMPNAQVGAPVGGAPRSTPPMTPSEELMQPSLPSTTMTQTPMPGTSARPGLAPRPSGLSAPAADTPVAGVSSPAPRPQASGTGGDFNDYIREQAKRYGVPENLAFSLITQESGGKQSAVSPKGAGGIMQLMPGTAKELGVDMNDPYQNIEGGMRYLSQQYERFGTWPLALAAYNAGPGAVEKYGGIPPFEETEMYVPTILNRAGMADLVPADDPERYRIPVIMTGDEQASGGDRTASEELASGGGYYGMFGDEYADAAARAQADTEMLKQSTKANREVAGDSMLDYLSDALQYLDMSGIAKGPQMPRSVGPGVYRPRGGGGTRALQRFGIASLA